MTHHAPLTHSETPHHRFAITGSHGALPLAAQATLHAPWTVLFGPSGSGKSTVLRALTGVLPELTVEFSRFLSGQKQSQILSSTSIRLPPEQRALAYSPQQAQLLPHLTAQANILFPEQVRRVPSTASALPALTALLDLKPLLARRPHQLSTGERQRVSLARALAVPDAHLLLLDEPFAGVDRTLRDRLLPALQRYLISRNLPVLSVTHDPDEVLLLGADVLRMHNGDLIAQGPPAATLADEISRLRNLLA